MDKPYLCDLALLGVRCILDRIHCVFHGGLGIAKLFFGLATYLFMNAFDLLGCAPDKFSNLFLDRADDVFGNSMDLIFVHD